MIKVTIGLFAKHMRCIIDNAIHGRFVGSLYSRRLRLIRVIYRWRVEPQKMHEFEIAWRQTTRTIHEDTAGALGSFCLQSVEDPSEVLTVALWETQVQWQQFIETARSSSMKGLHGIATQISATAYRQIGDETVVTS